MPDSNDNPREVIARGSIPIPDPTLLTTQQLYREIAIIRTLVDDRTSSVREVTDIRFKGLDTAIKLLSDNIIELTDRAVHEAKTLQARLDEKFKSVQIQFEERDKRSEQRAFADTTAVVAALQAQKDAVNSQNVANAAAASKSEVAFTKQIEQIQTILNTITESTNDKIMDIKARMGASEGRRAGGQENWSMLLSVAGVLIALGSLVTVVLLHPHG
jgi:hypothetical protein